MLGKDAVQRGAGFRVNSLVQVNAAHFGAGVWLINVLRPPPPRSSSRGTEGSNPLAPPTSPSDELRRRGYYCPQPVPRSSVAGANNYSIEHLPPLHKGGG